MFGDNGSIGSLASMTGSGALVVLGSAVAFAVVCGAAGAMTRDLHPLRAPGLGLSATSGLLLFVFFAQGRGFETIASLPALDLAILAYTGLFGTGLAYLAFVSRIHLSRSAAIGVAPTLIEPGVADILAALILHERLAPIEMAGCLLMIGAMIPLIHRDRRGSS